MNKGGRSKFAIYAIAFAIATLGLASVRGVADTPPAGPGGAAGSAASSAPAAAPSPIPFKHRVIFVLGTGDAPTRGKLIESVITHMESYRLVQDAWLIAEPDWGLSDYVSACAKQWRSTQGALFVTLTAAGSGAIDQFFQRQSWGEVAGMALYIDCTPPDGVLPQPEIGLPYPTSPPAPEPPPKSILGIYDPQCLSRLTQHLPARQIKRTAAYGQCFPPTPEPKAGSPAVAWHSKMKDRDAWHTTPLPLNPLAALLSIAGIVETIVPSKTSQTQTMFVYPTKKPLSPNGTISSNQITSSSTSNPSNFGTSAGAFFANAVAESNAAVSVPLADETTWNAVERVVDEIAEDMNCEFATATPPPWHEPPGATPAPSPAPLCANSAQR